MNENPTPTGDPTHLPAKRPLSPHTEAVFLMKMEQLQTSLVKRVEAGDEIYRMEQLSKPERFVLGLMRPDLAGSIMMLRHSIRRWRRILDLREEGGVNTLELEELESAVRGSRCREIQANDTTSRWYDSAKLAPARMERLEAEADFALLKAKHDVLLTSVPEKVRDLTAQRVRRIREQEAKLEQSLQDLWIYVGLAESMAAVRRRSETGRAEPQLGGWERFLETHVPTVIGGDWETGSVTQSDVVFEMVAHLRTTGDRVFRYEIPVVNTCFGRQIYLAETVQREWAEAGKIDFPSLEKLLGEGAELPTD